MLIKLDKSTSSLIKSQHTYKSFISIIKELIENSLDAFATKITIYLTDDSLSIQDNGEGISDLSLVGEMGCTSKSDELNNVFSEKSEFFSYGYRGMALFTLSNISKLVIQSGMKEKDFVKNITKFCHIKEGTIIQVNDLFYNLPVRKKLLKIKKELPSLIELIKSFLIVNPISISLYYFDKLIYANKSDLLALFSQNFTKFDTNKFTIFYAFNSSSSIYMFYLKRPVLDRKLKILINSLIKGIFILIIKEKCDINSSSEKNEVLIRNREIFINELREYINGMNNDYLNIEYEKINNNKSEESKIIKENNILITDNEMSVKLEMKKIEYNVNNINDIIIENNIKNKDNTMVNDDDNIKSKCVIIKNNDNNIKNINDNCKNINDNKIEKNVNYEIPSPKSSPFTKIIKKIQTNNKINQILKEKDPNINSSNYIPKKEDIIYNTFKKIELIPKQFLINKSDFLNMNIIGQFNNGFILCSLNNSLIIIDQHAASEIKNYELIKANLIIKKQKLIQPIKIQLSPWEEILLEEKSKLLDENGFKVEKKEEMFYLVTLPVVSGVNFTYEDFLNFFEELRNDGVFYSRINDIIASKACRMSVMIGERLEKREMVELVKELHKLSKPWWCPHGRPVCKFLL